MEGETELFIQLIQWAKNNDILRIVIAEFLVSTSTRTIVEVIMNAIKNGLTGLYHLANSGYASRYEWVKESLRLK